MKLAIFHRGRGKLTDIHFDKDTSTKECKQPFLILAIVGIVTVVLSSVGILNLSQITKVRFEWGVIVIAVALDIFTEFMKVTGLLEVVAKNIAPLSGGRPMIIMVMSAAILFVISSVLNNITAVLVMIPILVVILGSIDVDQAFASGLFALLLAACNLGGAATPIGDFPAIVIMKSGLISFSAYLLKAFPLCVTTLMIVIASHLIIGYLRKGHSSYTRENQNIKRLIGIQLVEAQYRHNRIRWHDLWPLSAVFMVMFLCWTFLPPDRIPAEAIALAGVGLAAVIVPNVLSAVPSQHYNLNPILKLGAFLLIGASVASTGAVELCVAYLESHVSDPKTSLLL